MILLFLFFFVFFYLIDFVNLFWRFVCKNYFPAHICEGQTSKKAFHLPFFIRYIYNASKSYECKFKRKLIITQCFQISIRWYDGVFGNRKRVYHLILFNGNLLEIQMRFIGSHQSRKTIILKKSV